MPEHIRRIVERAIHAPSADNIQPWILKCDDKIVRVYNDTAGDTSFYNHGQCASLTSIGALIENLCIAASEERIGAEVRLFPDTADISLVGEIMFAQVATPDQLAQYIEKRTTNRRPYLSERLPSQSKESLIKAVTKVPNIRVVIAEGDAKDEVARLSSANERVVLENPEMRNFFFSHITWTKEEDAAHPGFFVDTLELNPVQKRIFRLFSKPRFAKILNSLGASRLVASENAKVYQSSSAILGIILKQSTPESYVRAGMAMQRVWLTATSLGLSVQPLAGVCFLSRYVLETKTPTLSSEHVQMLKSAYARMRELLNVGEDHIAIALRVGSAAAPSARTLRRKLAVQ